MQLALGFTDFTPPTFTVTPSGGTYTIVSSEPLWKNHPYIALKYTNGTYGHMNATPAGTNTWTVTPPTSVSVIGVAGSDLYGNPGSARAYATTSAYPPTAAFTATPTTQYVGQPITFDASTSADGFDGTNPTTITNYAWNFGDRTYGSGISASHAYSIVGNYTVQLTVTDSLGQTDTISHQVTIALETFGNTEGASYTDVRGLLNEIAGSHFVCPASGTLQSISIYMYASAGSTVECAIYTRDSALSGTLVAVSEQKTFPTASTNYHWETFAITAPLAASQDYWLFARCTGTDVWVSMTDVGTDPTIGAAWTATSFPSTFTVPYNSPNLYSIYATIAPEYALTVSTVGSGSVVKSPDQATYAPDFVVTLTATAAPGWSFSAWSGDVVSSVNPVQVTMHGAKFVTATFTQEQYTVSVTVNPSSAAGTVTGYVTTPTYHYGDVVVLTESPNKGYTFSSWGGDGSGSATTCQITVTGNMAVTATFTQNEYTLTISYAGDGSGSVSTDKSAPYHYGDVVQLTASAADGSSFSSWSGDLGGSVNPTTITIDGNKAVTATFARIVYTLTIHTTGSGSVSTDKSAPYYWGDVVQLTASPATDWSFQYWGGDLSGSANITMITMKADHDVTANFINKPTLSMDPTSKTCRMYGENFNVTITVSNAANVAGFAFEVHYNTTLLDYVGVTWNVWSPGTITVDEVGGKITVSNSGTPTINGTEILVTITFTASVYHIWKSVTGYTNDLTDTIYFQSISIGYTSGPSLQYSRGDSTQINVGPDFVYTFSPIQGDVNNDGAVDVLDLRVVAYYYDVKQGDSLWSAASTYDLNGDGVIDIFDLVIVASNIGARA